MVCPCGVDVTQPWGDRNTLWSPASVVGGAIVIALGVAAIAWFHALFGVIVLGVFGMAIVVATVLQARRGHRGWCLVRRAAWFGLAAPGSPVRVIVNSP